MCTVSGTSCLIIRERPENVDFKQVDSGVHQLKGSSSRYIHDHVFFYRGSGEPFFIVIMKF